MAIKETVFALDLTKEGRHPVVKFRLNDNKVQKITFRLTNNGRDVDLERELGDQFKPVFECIFRDKTFKRDEDQGNWEIKRDVTSKYPLYTFTYYLTDEVINKSGIACYYFALETPEGLRISTPTLKMVIDCDFKEDGKPSDNYVSEFEKLLKEAGRVKQTIKDLDETLKEVLAGGASITEVIRAREDATGVIFKDLKERLDTKERKYDDITSKNSEAIKKIIEGLDQKTENIVFLSDYKSYVTKKDGNQDWAPAVQKSIDDCPQGGMLILNVKEIPCYGNLSISKPMRLEGLGRDQTTFLVYSKSGNGFINYESKRTTSRSFGFYYPEQVRTNTDLIANDGKPIVYPPAMWGNGYYSSFEDIQLGNSYIGMRFGIEADGVIKHSASSIVINNVIGTPFFRGLVLDACRDIPKITGIHFNRNVYAESPKELESSVVNWIANNGYAFHFGRVDFGTIQNLFGFGYQRGLLIQSISSTGAADRLRFASCQFDQTQSPLWIQNFTNNIMFDNCIFVSDGKTNSYNVINNPNTGQDLIVFNGCSFDNYFGRALSTQANVILNDTIFHRFGTGESYISEAVYCNTPGKRIIVDGCTFDAAKFKKCRGLFNNESDNFWVVRNSIFKNFGIVNDSGLEPYRITTGKITDENNFFLNNNSDPRTQIDFIKPVRRFKGKKSPEDGSYNIGDTVENIAPLLGDAHTWVCVASGSPGTWVVTSQAGHRTLGTSPINAGVTPYFRGEELLDTLRKKWYKSTGLTSNDWVEIN
ncbi:TPA: BppU family phage baseplate upper protein [Bacillus cereus]